MSQLTPLGETPMLRASAKVLTGSTPSSEGRFRPPTPDCARGKKFENKFETLARELETMMARERAPHGEREKLERETRRRHAWHPTCLRHGDARQAGRGPRQAARAAVHRGLPCELRVAGGRALGLALQGGGGAGDAGDADGGRRAGGRGRKRRYLRERRKKCPGACPQKQARFADIKEARGRGGASDVQAP